MANHQNFIDGFNWFHYLNLDDTFHFGCKLNPSFALEHEYNAYNLSFELAYNTNHLSHDQNDIHSLDDFRYFDPIDDYLTSWEYWQIDQELPLLSNNNIDHHHNVAKTTTTTNSMVGGAHFGGRKRSKALKLEEIEKCYEMPIVMAAKELSVGLTALKKRCRELNIKRWPYRKLKSLKILIKNVKELGLNEEIEMLEEQKRMMEKLPEMQYTQRTKKLRQACFKATYIKRRCN